MTEEATFQFIAHVRQSDSAVQTVEEHLLETSNIAGQLASKLNLEKTGTLIGFLHDLGKFSEAFQKYIRFCTGTGSKIEDIDFDADAELSDVNKLKGKIDHSTAAAQWIIENYYETCGFSPLWSQIINICLVSHHGGLIDSIDPNGKDNYRRRISKEDKDTNFSEAKSRLSAGIIEKLEQLNDLSIKREAEYWIKQIFSPNLMSEKEVGVKVREFFLGCLTRFLFSCLVDADRISSADFENRENSSARFLKDPDWGIAVERFESFFKSLKQERPIDKIRGEISERCRQTAEQPTGIFSLSVPTGGGKTFSSLRFAIHHAKRNNLKKIIYVIPYTSIIEQNAQEIRKILERKGEEFSSWVLEHHSNLEPDKQDWKTKLFSENWDSPIVVTTMVQFLEAWFGGGTRSVRRLHQMVRAVLVFDEVQTLPIKCVHMFCNAMNFIAICGKSTVVLCTATQPVLSQLKNGENKGELLAAKEIIGNADEVNDLFAKLERVEVINKCKSQGWRIEDIAELAMENLNKTGSCIVIVNTKIWAKKLFMFCKNAGIAEDVLFHLSTNQCPAHRKSLLNKIKQKLEIGLPVLCFSTQLIEAGVDISFHSGIRFLAGLDSIAQAAGRVNRHGLMMDKFGKPCRAKLFVVNPEKENISRLVDIAQGQKSARRVLEEIKNGSLLQPESIKKYFQYHFFERADEMVYRFKHSIGKDDTIFNLLSDNCMNTFSQKNNVRLKNKQVPLLMQSFATAGKVFAAIEAPTKSVIVPYGLEGRQIIATLCSDLPVGEFKKFLRDAQKFSINVFPNAWNELLKARCVYEIPKTGVFYLDEQYYDLEFGLATEKVAEADFLLV